MCASTRTWPPRSLPPARLAPGCSAGTSSPTAHDPGRRRCLGWNQTSTTSCVNAPLLACRRSSWCRSASRPATWAVPTPSAPKRRAPPVTALLRHRAAAGMPAVVVVPIGFVSDHMEVRYDLDTEAAATAADLGLRFARAATPGTDERFVALVRELLVERAAVERSAA